MNDKSEHLGERPEKAVENNSSAQEVFDEVQPTDSPMDNYFDHEEENAVHDAFLMIIDSRTDYENIEDVLMGETIFDERSIREWKQKRE